MPNFYNAFTSETVSKSDSVWTVAIWELIRQIMHPNSP